MGQPELSTEGIDGWIRAVELWRAVEARVLVVEPELGQPELSTEGIDGWIRAVVLSRAVKARVLGAVTMWH